MREYLLYVKEAERARQAYITPCFEVDKLFWEQRDGGGLHIIGKSPSLAMAFTLREKVNGYLLRHELTDQSLLKIKELAQSCVREASEIYGSAVGETAFPDADNKRPWFLFADDSRVEYHPVLMKDTNIDEREHLPPARLIEKEADKLLGCIAGRSLLWEETEFLLTKHPLLSVPLPLLLQWLVLRGQLLWQPGVRLTVRKSWVRHRLDLYCERCGSKDAICPTVCHTCRQGCAYCSACLEMGRSKCCTPYLCAPAGPISVETASTGKRTFVNRLQSRLSPSLGPEVTLTPSDRSPSSVLQWDGQYSPMQARAAEQARLFASGMGGAGQAFLLWAVCGAGKTELLFPAAAEMLSRRERVLIATPRKDVVLELLPRLQKVFPTVKVIAVHGSSEGKWEDGQLVIATTHQVMRCYRRFPLVVVDEVDAFPFHNNESLYRAVSRAVTSDGKLLYLSATPPRYLQKRLVSSRLGVPALSSPTHVLLPGRYHGHPLPVPQIVVIPKLHKRLSAGRRVEKIVDAIISSLQQKRQVFLFAPRIEDTEKYLHYVQMHAPEFADEMTSVHASDPEREKKVLLFREKKYKLLVTTTILERGVTIPKSDVIVLQADAPVFDEASLVQIAGRVGRSADSPDGTILFAVNHRTKAACAAVKQIKRMNRLAAKLQQSGALVQDGQSGKAGQEDVC